MWTQSLIGFAGVVIGSIATMSGKILESWFESKSKKYSNKISYFERTQKDLLQVINSQLPSLISFDEDNQEKYLKSYYEKDIGYIVKVLTNFKDAYYLPFMPIFFQNRHYLPKKIRNQCDSHYKKVQRLMHKSDDLTSLSLQDKQELIVSFFTLTSLVFLGIIKILEIINDEIISS